MVCACCVGISPINSQKTAEEILTLPEELQLRAIWFWDSKQYLEDTLATYAYFKKLASDFTSRKEFFLAKQARMASLEFSTIQLHLYRPYSIVLINEAIEEAKKKGWKEIEAECYLRKGLLYYKQWKYGSAFEYIQKGYMLLKDIGFDKCPLIIRHLEEIGLAYYEFGDPEGAIHYLREALAQTPVLVEIGEKRKTMNTIAVCFNQLEQYDSSIHYLTLAHDESVFVHDTFWAALTDGNKGYVFYLQEKYDEALPLMKMDFQQSIRYKEWPSAVNAAMTLATIHLKKGEIEKAEIYLDFAQKYKNYSDPRHMSGFYKNLATISRLKGNYTEAFNQIDSFLFYKEEFEKEKNSKTINQARLKVEVDQHASELKLLETARSRQVLIRNGLLLIVILTGIFAVVIVQLQRTRQIKEKQLATLREQAANVELENAKKQLGFFTTALKEKNELVESFMNELALIHQSGQNQANERTENIQLLVNSTILTEEDWKNFRQMFDLVYPGFFIRLKEKLQDLTPAETRLLALTKLQLAPKEMASMLGISYDAIKKSRQRLRKKINLPEEGSLDELVEMI
jgi:tetratricopeptide (TPR) repeat protein